MSPLPGECTHERSLHVSSQNHAEPEALPHAEGQRIVDPGESSAGLVAPGSRTELDWRCRKQRSAGRAPRDSGQTDAETPTYPAL